jgi:hypothetical protein
MAEIQLRVVVHQSRYRIGTRMMALGFTGMISAGLLAACGHTDHVPTPTPTPTPEETVTQIRINELYGLPWERRLEMGVDSCNDNPTVEAVETEDEVQLTVTIIGEPSGLDCQDGVEITLEKPLGDRRVWDTLTGKVLEPRALGKG